MIQQRESSMEGSTIREAVAVFDDPERLESAVSALQSAGIDRSELSILAHTSLAERPVGDLRRAAEDPGTPREPVVSDTDLRQGRVLGTSLAATIAALAAAGGVGASGALFGRILADDQASFLDAQLARGGVLLWVRTRDVAAERGVLEVLRRHSAHVYVHDLPTNGPSEPLRNDSAQAK